MASTTPMEVTHRGRALVNVKLECGCVLTYELEFESSQPRYTVKHLAVAIPGGWWVPTLPYPGEVTKSCNRIGSKCALGVETEGMARDGALRKALDYIRTVSPSRKLSATEAVCKD